MEVAGKTAVVTGAAGGIGRALAEALAAAGARVVVADLEAGPVEEVAAATPGEVIGTACDVRDGAAIGRLIELAAESFGQVDLFCANAGVAPGAGVGDEDEWVTGLDVNLMAHVKAARLLLPGWLERGHGYFVATASAAGLLTQIGSAPYAVTKHAAVAFAEWLSLTYGAEGIGVSCICPMGVRTRMFEQDSSEVAVRAVAAAGSVIEPEDVAREALAAIAAERFLVLPHPEVLRFFQNKANDYERWLAGMRHFNGEIDGGN